jgi:DNA-binding MarR family transcriptional regulator
VLVTSTPPQERTSYLLSAIGAHAKIRFTRLLAPLGVQPAHFAVLRRLSTHEGSTQQEVADDMRVRRSVMVGLIDELEGGGWVERRRHPVDRRANALHLTAAGKRLLARCERVADQLDDELLLAIPGAHRQEFLRLLQGLGLSTGVADGIYPHADTEISATRQA